ncbi:hypothetical protein JGS22_008930 [Streptomyces sp. P38-E01]|uniref:Uncharacterized protein n=1 Tax=Streptomyces tardus TaxID=2780544 RepID=A0A949N8A6_9ACTN|nr:hypothetical protein [Streptomyces tardus]MBU7597738.1 hypothetical protein [Streptomyces tardus]
MRTRHPLHPADRRSLRTGPFQPEAPTGDAYGHHRYERDRRDRYEHGTHGGTHHSYDAVPGPSGTGPRLRQEDG